MKQCHDDIVSSVNPDSIIDYLFQEDVIGIDNVTTLQKIKDDPKEKCRFLLTLLHNSGHPKAFVKLYERMEQQSHLGWLVEKIKSCRPIRSASTESREQIMQLLK